MNRLSAPSFEITDRALEEMRAAGVPDEVLSKLVPLKNQTFRGMQSFLGALPINHEENSAYSLSIIKAAENRGKKARRRQKKTWRQRIKKPSLKLYSTKIVHSTILSALLLVAIFGLNWLVRALFPGPVDFMIGFIKWAENWLHVLMFMVFLTVKILDNLGIIGE